MLSCRFILLTNNPRFQDALRIPVDFRDVAGREIITAGRDLIHLGWTLLNHPLYGNFRPHQQPFRTLLLKKDDGDVFDEWGLSLIENAWAIYDSNHRPLTPDRTPERMLRDCSEIDYELMKETLLKYNLLHE